MPGRTGVRPRHPTRAWGPRRFPLRAARRGLHQARIDAEPERAPPHRAGEEVVELGRAPLPVELESSRPLGSTDMGNVTHVLPGIHPVVGLDSGGAVTHQPEFAAAAAGESADQAVLDGATALARTAIRAALDPDQRARLLEGVERR